ncbi:MAG: M20/M25/M40 family metallo-hydrolase [Sphaerochaeta sp.]|jgi:putative aminopeptidase FrvX|nr:M20/M25/M40 family metallo-hydrolase [Sphaerochaeta sp.]MCH3919662.1 M20/M25/M40 family metallo-hydrolase [Sphaerochaeta sp.]MCI2045507.1 M20/M25/M40 family metallo-hydrolase [Sphaerochaeta sp.]MCI2076684.1 M20/M25/M40 family metallo-hydrolase [Sphaerochaeta sp.]MCI2096502.1 M20/M25/M40 family metallo-hydrolase [Sphaerochaeta sp.]
MEREEQIGLIKRLCDANGISGFEDEVVALVKQESASLGKVSVDSMLNVYVERRGNKKGLPMVQLDAHTDEVGFMVKCIRPDGMLEFITIGGWVATNIPAHLVRIKNREGVYIQGLVGSKPPHFMTEAERKAPLDPSQLFIDVGAKSLSEVTDDFKIDPGAPIVPEATTSYDPIHQVLMGKAFDNRMGCASIIETMRELEGADLKVNITGAFATQEEVGCRGAAVTCQRVKPSIAICFEGCPADDTVLPEYQVQTALGKGPMLRYIDAKMITNPRFEKYALDLAKELGIPTQAAVRSGGATNGSAIHLSNGGVPVIVIGIPVRYAHTHYGYSSMEDFHNGVKLAVEILKRLDEKAIAAF